VIARGPKGRKVLKARRVPRDVTLSGTDGEKSRTLGVRIRKAAEKALRTSIAQMALRKRGELRVFF